MKTIGLLGGMSWESTASYYSLINKAVSERLEGLHSAKIFLCSVDFYEIEKLQHAGKWDDLASMLSCAAMSIETGGADCLVICTNTMHKVFSEIEERISIPVIHIADATANSLLADGIKKVGLLGTQFTMSQEFYKDRLIDKHGIGVIVPSKEDQVIVHDIIYEELCRGIFTEKSKVTYISLVEDLYRQGAEAVILGCTEIALLIDQGDTHVPLYDTTKIHALKAVDFALQENGPSE